MRVETIAKVNTSGTSGASADASVAAATRAPAAMVAQGSTCCAVLVHHGRCAGQGAANLASDWSRLPVVVQVTTVAHSHPALWFAATQAHRRHVPLVVVHAWNPNARTGSGLAGSCLEQAAAVVSDSRDLCRAIAPAVMVEGRLLQADVHSMVEQQSRLAQLLVMALPSRSRWGVSNATAATKQEMSALLSPRLQRTVRGSHCPVAVAWMNHAQASPLHPHIAWQQRSTGATPLIPRQWAN